MEVYLTHGSSTRKITGILGTLTWSGDKNAISRQLDGELTYIEGSGLPAPDVGNRVTLLDGGTKHLPEIVLLRSLGSEDTTMTSASALTDSF